MLIENKIKGIFLWIMSLLFFALTFKILAEHNFNYTFYHWLALLIIAFIGLSGTYIFRLGRDMSLIGNIVLVVLGIILSTIIVYQTGGVNSAFFPNIYFILLIFTSFNKGKKLFYLSTILNIILVLLWIFINHSFFRYVIQIDFIFKLAVYITIVYNIRNYRIECLTCYLSEDSCSNSAHCLLYQIKWNNSLGDEVDAK